MNKINYYKMMEEELKRVSQFKKKPTLLLHACCGPCSTYPLLLLKDYFEITVFFNNSNIFPEKEYIRRLNELKRFLEEFQHEYDVQIKLIVKEYNSEQYNQDLEPFKNEPEGFKRCQICYKKRIGETVQYAEENGYQYVTTVMSISRQKDSQILNKIASGIMTQHENVKYLYSDFKKNRGIDIAREMRDKYHLYQQLYCGCKFTYQKGLKKEQEKTKID